MPSMRASMPLALLVTTSLYLASCVANRSVSQDVKAATLISQLQQSTPEGIRYSRYNHYAYFLPFADSDNSDIRSECYAFIRPELRAIAALGIDAVPALLAHLDDGTALSVQQDFPFGYPHLVLAYGDFTTEFPPRRTHEFDELARQTLINDAREHKLTVGDLCFFALGQIVNEIYLPYRFVTPHRALVTSPSHLPQLASRLRERWRGLTKPILLEKFRLDLLHASSSHRRIGAYMRLMYYFPNESEDMVARSVLDSVSSSIRDDTGSFVSDLNLDLFPSVTAAIASLLDNPLLAHDTREAAALGLVCVEQLIRRNAPLGAARIYCERRRDFKWFAAGFREKLAILSAERK